MKDKSKIVTIILAVVCVISIIGVIYLYTANSSLKSENANLQLELENAQSQLEELQEKITELETTIETLEEAKASLEAEQAADNTEVTTESTDTDAEGGLIMDAAGVDGVISDEDIAAGAYDEELNGEDTTSSEDTTDWEDVDLSQVSEEERQAILDEMKKKYREDIGFNPDEIFNGSSESVPDHIEGNPLPEGKYTPDNGELPHLEFGRGGTPDSIKGGHIY